jgi:hypothetical protein
MSGMADTAVPAVSERERFESAPDMFLDISDQGSQVFVKSRSRKEVI